MAKRTHGHNGKFGASPEYQTWNRMIQRCHNPKHTSFNLYGGRGIQVCPEWRASFQAFLDHVGPKPGKGFSLDRFPNNNGNYEPGNVRWATPMDQARNTRRNKFVTHEGETLCVAEWAKRLGINANSVFKRLKHPERDPFRPKLQLREYCRRGHKFSPENTYFYGHTRTCRKCHNLTAQRYEKKRNLLRMSPRLAD